MRQAKKICGLPQDKRLAFIAEGLPKIFQSARSLLDASRSLPQFPTESEILALHSQEENAKILILIDIARCPKRLIASCIGPMMGWFYHHLARLLYAEAQHWKPTSIADLQRYVDHERTSHYLEGDYGEYILQNSTQWNRESSLYVDVACDEDGNLDWFSPHDMRTELSFDMVPISFQVVDALDAFGAFTPEGIKILHAVWGAEDFTMTHPWDGTRELVGATLDALDTAGLITDRAARDHTSVLVNHWQMPMYCIDFAMRSVSREALEESRPQDYEF